MSKQFLTSHVNEGGYAKAWLISLLGHTVLAGFFLLIGGLLPEGEPIPIGTGPGGGRGGVVSVGLAADLGGGAGMYKPALTPVPEAIPPPPAPPKEEAKPEPPKPDENVFAEAAKSKRKETVEKKPAATQKMESTIPAGRIPRDPEPGKGGPGGGSPGAGGGFGGGQGVSIGAGSGEGVVDSWYARLVEQKIGGNWLKTLLGQLERPVQTVMSFEIRSDGTIENIKVEESSGIRTMDLAAERAVRASNPLPRVPYEFRGRRLRFVAYFKYPPR